MTENCREPWTAMSLWANFCLFQQVLNFSWIPKSSYRCLQNCSKHIIDYIRIFDNLHIPWFYFFSLWHCQIFVIEICVWLCLFLMSSNILAFHFKVPQILIVSLFQNIAHLPFVRIVKSNNQSIVLKELLSSMSDHILVINI